METQHTIRRKGHHATWQRRRRLGEVADGNDEREVVSFGWILVYHVPIDVQAPFSLGPWAGCGRPMRSVGIILA